MTLGALIFAAVTVVFPPEAAKLPALARCYVMGAADAGERSLGLWCPMTEATNVVSVGRTGAWAAVVEVVPGTNVVEIGGVRRTFVVEPPGVGGQASVTKRYQKLEYAADQAKPHPAGRKPEEITIVLDAGHGGDDSGALSPHGLPEKDANLRLARDVRRALERRGFRVVMTRDDDLFVALYDRPKVAHASEADAFISIHHNAPGYETNPLRCRFQAVYAWNALGERMAEAISAHMAAARPEVESRGVIHANFAVTRNPEIPSCLIEADFVTHPDGEAAAWCVETRARLAEAIAEGVVQWLD